MTDEALESALLVPVPEVEPLVGELREAHDPSAGAGIPAHISLLYPFARPATIDEPMVERLRVLFGASPAFRYVLEGTGWFGGEVLYLSPNPAAPFVWLTEALAARFPDLAPYGGAFEEIVPHVTVAMRGSEAMEDRLRAGLPISATASEALLMVEARDGRWSVRARFAIGSGAETRPADRPS